jgi:hypothetical protein
VLGQEFGLEFGDGAVLGVGVVLAALVGSGEGGWAVLAERLLPVGEEVDGAAVFLADVRARGLVEEMLTGHGDLLLRSDVTALPGHGCSSGRVLPLTLPKANSCSDCGKTPVCLSLRRQSIAWVPSIGFEILC